MKLKRIVCGLLLLGSFVFMQCSKADEPFMRDNPLDPGGTKWYPPTVKAMGPASVWVGDSFTVRATGIDSNGTISEYLWAFDGVTYRDTTESGIVRVAFSTVGVKTIRVKVVDDDGIESGAYALMVTVKGDAPINVSPVNGMTLTTTQPTLAWLPGKFRTSFTVRCDTINPPATVIHAGNADSSYTPAAATDLKAGRTYFWQVTGLDTLGRTASGEIWQFNTPLSAGMKTIQAAGDSFSMGQVNIAEPVHTVIFKYDFCMDSTEVTQAEYYRVMRVNPSSFRGDSLRPMEYLTWFDAALYCNRRSKLEGKDTVYGYIGISGTPGNGCSGLSGLTINMKSNGYRLPTEAEWEYACRAGSTTLYWWGSDTNGIGARAWYYKNSDNSTNPVAAKLANRWGLYDMAGNVWEWCNDWYSDGYIGGTQTDPTGPSGSPAITTRASRGGSYSEPSNSYYASAYRHGTFPGSRSITCGFRTVFRVYGSAPLIVTHPNTQSVSVGQSVTFSAWATGAPPPSYQWRKNNVNIPGAILANFTLEAVQRSDTGRYSVVVSNSQGKDTSNAAMLTVSYVPITITAHPQNLTVTEGQSARFSVTVTGSNPQYQWQRDGINIPGATASAYATPAVVPADDGALFRCVVRNDRGSVFSSQAMLTVKGISTDSMIAVPPGAFEMGSTVSPSELPLHMVTISAFNMSNTEITQVEYLRVMGLNPSQFTGDLKCPVEYLTWFDAVLYCNRRSFLEGRDSVYTYTGITGTPGNGCSALSGLTVDTSRNGYRLPTEAEWEYACRAGTISDFYWEYEYPPSLAKDTTALDTNAWWAHNSGSRTHPVATRQPNPYGLYDMAGNVLEWCNDWYGAYSSGMQVDPAGPSFGGVRVARGGSWADNALDLRCASRTNPSSLRINRRGFRVVSR